MKRIKKSDTPKQKKLAKVEKLKKKSNVFSMIPCVSLTETSVLGSMKDRVKEMRVFGCRLNFWHNVKELNHKDKDKEKEKDKGKKQSL